MKTSTKLLSVLFACLLLSMVAYGYLLKQQFNKGIFFKNIYEYHSDYVFTAATFKHVVVDGNLFLTVENPLTQDPKKIETKNETRSTYVLMNKVVEFTATQNETGYSVLNRYKDIVKTRIQNDTLYISFFKLNGKTLYNYDPNAYILSINNGNLESLNLKAGSYSVNRITGKNLSLKLQSVMLTVEEVSFDSLKVLANEAEEIKIDSSNISSFQYSLLNHSKLNLINNKIKSFKNLGTDNLSEISLNGKAKDMEKFLQDLSIN